MTEDISGTSKLLDRFEEARQSLLGAPGFQRRNRTISSIEWSLFPQATWIVETLKTDDSYAIFLQVIDREGGQRLVLPRKVCEAIYNQHASIMKTRRSLRAQRAAEVRKKRGDKFFVKKESH